MKAIGLGILALAAGSLWAQPAPPAPPAPSPRPAPAPEPQRGRAITIRSEGGYLGIGVADISPERAKALNMKEVRGAEVTSVRPDSPAAKAGIKESDVVLEYNGENVEGTAQLQRMVRETPPDRQVKIVIWRNGGTHTVTATTGTPNETTFFGGGRTVTIPELNIPNFTMPDIPRMQMAWQNPRLGIVGESLDQEDQLADFFGVKDGVLVKSVLKDSAAEKAGIKAGDVIVKVEGVNVSTTEQIARELRRMPEGNTKLDVVVVRNKKETPITVTVESQQGRRRTRAVVVFGAKPV